MVSVSDAANSHDEAPHGTTLLASDLTEAQLDAAPVLSSVDALLIEDLTDDEDDAFATALSGEGRRRHGSLQRLDQSPTETAVRDQDLTHGWESDPPGSRHGGRAPLRPRR